VPIAKKMIKKRKTTVGRSMPHMVVACEQALVWGVGAMLVLILDAGV
jgi:hypothetical protein